MTADRRGYDPYAPAPPRATSEPVDERAESDVGSPTSSDGSGVQGDALESLRKADLIRLAGDKKLNTSGTRTDLIARLREAE